MSSYFGELYQSFKNLKGVPATLAGIVLGVLPFFFAPNASIPVKYAIVVGLAGAMPVIVLFDASRRMYLRTRAPLPHVLRALAPTPAYKSSVVLLLIEPSELFGQQAYVSIFCMKDGFEVLVAWGITATVQEDRKIQVVVREAIDSSDETFWESVRNNDSKALAQLIIKPSVPADVLGLATSNV